MPEHLVAGWDLGGAHLKLAVASPGDRLIDVVQVPCPLWLGLERLEQAVEEVRPRLPVQIRRHAVTMTGELVDLFANRSEGVGRLIDTMTGAFPDGVLRIYAGRSGYLSPGAARDRPEAVASANWLASASYVAARLDESLFIDLGSTTADVLPVSRGQVQARGMTDSERLVSEELLYTGLTRTPVMALADRVPFGGERHGVMAEYFATMADVHRLTGRLPEGADQHPAADGGDKSEAASARRLARMLGCDLESAQMTDWRRLAAHLAEQQLRSLQDAAARALSRGILSEGAPVVGAGIGRFLAADLAARLGRPYRDFETLVDGTESVRVRAACCAPAAAVALLAIDDW